MATWMFIFFGTLAILAALGVIIQRNPVHSLLSLVLTLLIIAVLFVGLGAVAVGLLQAIVYVGAILVLFLFVIWLLNLQVETVESGRLALKLLGALLAAALSSEIWLLTAGPAKAPAAPPPNYGTVGQLARLIFVDYLVAFEVTSVLLLIAVVGAVAVARRRSGAAPIR